VAKGKKSSRKRSVAKRHISKRKKSIKRKKHSKSGHHKTHFNRQRGKGLKEGFLTAALLLSDLTISTTSSMIKAKRDAQGKTQ